jgi:hypothetical protein
MDSDVDESDSDDDMPFGNSNRVIARIQDLDDIDDENDNGYTDRDRNTGVDESQIPAVVEVAMDAVLSCMSEIMTPALIIHDITGAIQSVLHPIGRHKAPYHTNIDYNKSDNGDVDLDVSDLNSHNPGDGINDEDHLALLSELEY